MTEEATFLAAIRANPNDDTTRLAYADWLDEHGRPGGVFLRAECELFAAASDDPLRAELRARLRDASAGVELGWVARVVRAPIGNCGADPGRSRWEQLWPAHGSDVVRHCCGARSGWNREVVFCSHIGVAQTRAALGECFAIDPRLARTPGDLESRPGGVARLVYTAACDMSQEDVGGEFTYDPHCVIADHALAELRTMLDQRGFTEAIREAIHAPDVPEAGAIRLLRGLDPGTRPIVEEALGDPSPRVRRVAALSVAAGAEGRLARAGRLRTDPDPAVRIAALGLLDEGYQQQVVGNLTVPPGHEPHEYQGRSSPYTEEGQALLVRFLADPDPAVRAAAIDCIPKTEEGQALLVRFQADPDPAVRLAVIRALVKQCRTRSLDSKDRLEQWSPEIRARLLRALEDEDAGVRLEVARVAHLDDVAGEAFTRRLGIETDPGVRKAILLATLGLMAGASRTGPDDMVNCRGETGRAMLLRELDNEDSEVRAAVVQVLTAMRGPDVASALLDRLRVEDVTAIWCSLIRFDGYDAIADRAQAALYSLFESDPDHVLRTEAAFALVKLGFCFPLQGIARLIALLDDPHSTTRSAAVQVLGQVGDAGALPALFRALANPSDRHWSSRIDTAIAAIARRSEAPDGRLPPEVHAQLLSALDNPDRRVPWEVVGALGRAGDASALPALTRALANASDTSTRLKLDSAIAAIRRRSERSKSSGQPKPPGKKKRKRGK